MGAHKTCAAYKSVRTKRGSELRCSKWSKKKGKAICARGLKGGARSKGLIHAANCNAGGATKSAKRHKSKR